MGYYSESLKKSKRACADMKRLNASFDEKKLLSMDFSKEIRKLYIDSENRKVHLKTEPGEPGLLSKGYDSLSQSAGGKLHKDSEKQLLNRDKEKPKFVNRDMEVKPKLNRGKIANNMKLKSV